MKCSKCGAEIRVGSVYCANCGEAAQIVPDYNVLEDDMLLSFVEENNKKKAQNQAKDNAKPNNPQKNTKCKNKKLLSKKNHILLCVLAILILLSGSGLGIWIYTSSYSYLMNKAIKLDEQKDYGQAVIYYEKAAAKNPAKEKPFILAGDDYVYLSDVQKAEEQYTKAITINPNSVKAYQGLINLYKNQSNYDAIFRLQANTTNKKVLELFNGVVLDIPIFSVEGGKYEDDVLLTLASADNTPIYYTLDGSEPDVNSPRFTEDITITEGDTIVNAICIKEDGARSSIIQNQYHITYKKPEMPKVTPSGGSFKEPGVITIEVPEGCSVYYTWDKTEPTTASTPYIEPLPIPEGNSILSLILVDKHGLSSDVLQCNYKLIQK